MKAFFTKVMPWLITIAALYYAFKGVEWQTLLDHVGSASPVWLSAAVLLTVFSYLFRARRWQHLFPNPVISYLNSLKVLILGFFMNNVLPARAGEFVRAHLGAKVTHETRTLVLATVASERLADGLTLSVIFVAFALGTPDQEKFSGLMSVVYLFAIAGIGFALLLINRPLLYGIAEKFSGHLDSRASRYATNRLQVFLDGLGPLYSLTRFPMLCVWSFVIWFTELGVYYFVQEAFGAELSLHHCVLFLVGVNFSALIPAAPGGIGVIEVVATTILVVLGVPREQALCMVIVQHVIQYFVIGIPGAFLLFNFKNQIQRLKQEDDLAINEQI